tara:strand:- start:330 stop:581 length:252 start_codon:yes stop_codon:yes gene_type:complete
MILKNRPSMLGLKPLKTKSSFKNAKQCLIFADGFYEWEWLDNKCKKKQKYLIELPNSELFSFAGLYDKWIDKKTGEIKIAAAL